MDQKQAEKVIRELTENLNRFNEEYYEKGESSVDDASYDLYMSQLIELETQFPTLLNPNSPSQRVGGQPTDQFENVAHKYPMLSLSNLYSEEDLKKWVDSLQAKLEKQQISTVCEVKIDGFAISVIYNNGNFSQAITRGNGEVGDDVTANVKTIMNLPLKLNEAVSLELRGEIFLPKSRFSKINERKIEAGELPFKNPRNAAAGTIRMKDPKIVAQRGLEILLYDVVEGASTNLHSTNLEYLESLGLPINSHRKECETGKEILDFCNQWQERKNTLPFDIDGVVIKINDLAERQILGFTAKSPRWATAWKFKAEKMASRLLSVENSIGRTGTLTPVAILEPIQLLGTEVKRATLHNYEQIERLNIQIGDTVFVEKGGDIIPKIVGVDLTKRPEDGRPLSPPECCPVCNSKLIKEKTEIDLKCVNETCPAILQGNLEHFVSKRGMDIQYLGSSIVKMLINKGFIRNLVDIFHLKNRREDLIELEGFGKKSVDNLLSAIELSKSVPLNQAIYSLGIRHIGEKAAKTIALKSGSLESFMNLKKEDLENLTDFGSIMAESVIQWLENEKNMTILKELLDAGLEPEILQSNQDARFDGKTVVITGTLSQPRNEWKQRLEIVGFKVTSSVSKNTDYLLAGEKAGSKLGKAQGFGTTVLDEDGMSKLLEE